MDTTKINEQFLIEHEDFLKTVLKATTIEEARAICAEYDVELPEDVWADVEKSLQAGDLDLEEMSEDQLENVSGGRIKISGKNLLTTVGSVIALGAAITVGAPAGVLLAGAWVGYNAVTIFRQ